MSFTPGDHQIREEDVRLMIREASSETIDAEVLPYYAVADLNPQSVLAYRNLFRITKINHPWNSLSDEEFLKRIKAVHTNREKNVTGVTKAGLLMFGDVNDIRDYFPNYYLDYLEKYNDDSSVRYDNKISSNQGTWSGNIFDFFQMIDRKLSEGLDIPFRLQGKQRIDDNKLTEVLREALINTLIHADYTGAAPVKITKSPSSFTFINPGDMRRPLALAKHGGISDCRNRILQTMFSHIGYGDQEGFGVAAIYDIWERETGSIPEYRELREPVATTLVLERKNPGVVLKGEPQESLTVNHNILNGEPQESLTANPTALSRDILIESLSADTREKIKKLGRRVSDVDDMKILIREICAQNTFTLVELATILNRKTTHSVYERYIVPLLQEQKLEKTNPEKPNHPYQRYRAILSGKK